MKSITILLILLSITAARADVQIQEANVTLGKLEHKGGRAEDGRPLYRSIRITDRDYITVGEIDQSLSYSQDYTPAVPYIVATGYGRVTVNMWVEGPSGQKVIASGVIDVRQGTGPTHDLNVLYQRGARLAPGNYGVTFLNNGNVVTEARFRVVDENGPASSGPQASSEVWVTCPTCRGSGKAENTSGKRGPNGEMIVTHRETVTCWTCDGRGKIKR